MNTRNPRKRQTQGNPLALSVRGANTPLAAVVLWWSMCYLFYAAQWPIRYSHVNFYKVSILFWVCAAALVIGYRSSVVRSRQWTAAGVGDKWPRWGLLLIFATFVPMVNSYSGLGVSQVGGALGDQSAAYQQTTDVINQGSSSRATLIIILTLAAPFTMAAPAYFMTRAFNGNRIDVICAALSVAPSLVLSVLTGRNQLFGVTVILCGASWLVASYRARGRLSIRGLLMASGAAAFVIYLISLRKQARMNGRYICRPGQLNCDHADTGVVQNAIGTLASYGSQGFEGLGRAMEGTWGFGGGFSHSPALKNMILGGSQGSTQTITDQLSFYGWSDKAYWSTAISQVANDVPWILIPVIFWCAGVLYGKLWRASVNTGDALYVTLFGYVVMALLFVPQNYQLGASGPTYIGFMLLLLLAFLKNSRTGDG